jgi:16S rRNA (cytosine1402-N4)-methyltransferase
MANNGSQMAYHIPALLNESIEGLDIRPSGVYVDVTFGGGGHSSEILRRLNGDGRLIAFDQDEDAVLNAIDDPRFTFIRSNFRFLKNFLRYLGVDEVDGVMADLGVSSHHFDDAGRGFSFRFEGGLDMRMNRSASKSAADILNEYPEEKLREVFLKYGELKYAHKIASSVIAYRQARKIAVTNDLLAILEPFTFKDREKKILAQAFQALRIEVNGETRWTVECYILSFTGGPVGKEFFQDGQL